jgi:flagellar protein FlgJ
MDIPPIASIPSMGNSSLLIDRLSHMSSQKQRHVVAQQFEAIILRQLLAPALKGMAGSSNGIYSYMLTDAFAEKLASGGGMGLASMLERQFTPRGEKAASAAPGAAAHPAAILAFGKKPAAQ